MTTAMFGQYVHNDAVTPAKGAAFAAVSGAADFAPLAARYAYAASAGSWADVVAAFPDVDGTRADLGAEVAGLAVMRLAPSQAGRVAAAIDGATAALAKVTCQTDFAAKTEMFRDFAARVAATAARLGADTWAVLAAQEPELEQERAALGRDLRERVEIAEIAVLRH